jgi:flagellar export protein FliJ
MSSFTFSLEAVLTLRAREEEAAKGNWALAVQAQTRAEEALAVGKEELENYHQLLVDQRNATFRLGDQHIYFGAIATLKALCERLTAKLAAAVASTKKQHAILLEARMKHEVLKRLKEKKFEEHRAALQAKDEAAVADLVIARYRARVTDR